jgi:hypothetical protein
LFYYVEQITGAQYRSVLRGRTLFPARVFDIPRTPPPEAGTPYAGGLLIRPFLGEPAIEHGGFMFGFQHHELRFPAQDVAVLIFTSSREIDSFALREQIVRAAFDALAARRLEARPAPATEIRPPSAAEPAPTYAPLDPAIAGTYSNEEIPLSIEIFVVDGQLHIHPATFRRVPMTRTGDRSFSALGGEFVVRIDSRAGTVMLTVRDLGDFVFSRSRISGAR